MNGWSLSILHHTMNFREEVLFVSECKSYLFRKNMIFSLYDKGNREIGI